MTSMVKMSKVAKEVAEEYASSLSDLTVNSKPLINMLTMLADENIMHAPIIVQAVEKHLQKVIFKVLFDIVTS
jgi:pre-mRNA cleavage complex 2 protein Pcf11